MTTNHRIILKLSLARQAEMERLKRKKIRAEAERIRFAIATSKSK